MRGGTSLESFVKARSVIEGTQLIPSEPPEDRIRYYAIVWGDNSYGQLGKPPSEVPFVDEDHPLEIPDVSKITFGDGSAYLLKTDGSLWVAGRNDEGQLGLGHTNDVHEWTRVPD